MATNKRKVTTAIVASVTALALLLGGTFAWQSINQTALNEASDVINPGGRLHDDFDGSNKDVYVENFADEDIFARIRLDEYFEIIMNKDVTGAERIESIAGKKDEDGNISSWATHKFDGTDATAAYWTWTTGGSTVYMPTFNKNKDSLAADINGTYYGPDGSISDEIPDDRYTDYYEYEPNEEKKGNAIYDADVNQSDELTDDGVDIAKLIANEETLDTVYNENVVLIEETHTAKSTLGATLISMAEWMALSEEEQVGEYWVYDTDGWVYWAQPIKPGTATGKLLDSIALTQVMDDSWYYAINVVAQFVTADDVGQNDGTGFYDTENGTVPSDNALALLEKIGVEVTAEGGEQPLPNNVVLLDGAAATEVERYNYYTMSVQSEAAYAMRNATAYTFTLAEGTPETITISDSKLTITAAEVDTQFTVIATPDSGEAIETTFTVKATPRIHREYVKVHTYGGPEKYILMNTEQWQMSLVETDASVTNWSVSYVPTGHEYDDGALSSGTTIDSDGLLTIADDEVFMYMNEDPSNGEGNTFNVIEVTADLSTGEKVSRRFLIAAYPLWVEMYFNDGETVTQSLETSKPYSYSLGYSCAVRNNAYDLVIFTDYIPFDDLDEEYIGYKVLGTPTITITYNDWEGVTQDVTSQYLQINGDGTFTLIGEPSGPDTDNVHYMKFDFQDDAFDISVRVFS